MFEAEQNTVYWIQFFLEKVRPILAMAAVITHKQPALHFPHNLLHDNRELQPFSKMDRHVPTKLSLPPISSLMKDIDRQTVKCM